MPKYRVDVGRRYAGYEWTTVEVNATDVHDAVARATAAAEVGQFDEMRGDQFIEADEFDVCGHADSIMIAAAHKPGTWVSPDWDTESSASRQHYIDTGEIDRDE